MILFIGLLFLKKIKSYFIVEISFDYKTHFLKGDFLIAYDLLFAE